MNVIFHVWFVISKLYVSHTVKLRDKVAPNDSYIKLDQQHTGDGKSVTFSLTFTPLFTHTQLYYNLTAVI